MTTLHPARTGRRIFFLASIVALLTAGSFGLAQSVSADGGNTITFAPPALTANVITFNSPTSGPIVLAAPETGTGTLTLLAPEPNTGNTTLAVVSPTGLAAAADTANSPSVPGTSGH